MTTATKQDIVKAFMLMSKYASDPKYAGWMPSDVYEDICRRVVKQLENNND